MVDDDLSDSDMNDSDNEHDDIKGYDDPDIHVPIIPPFTPTRQPGLHLPNTIVLRNSMNTALDFFSLFFDDELIEKISHHTNQYGDATILGKQTYGDKHGAWKETSPKEIRELIALLLYQGLVPVSTFSRYWSTKTLYHGLWARKIMKRDRFTALMSMLHIVDPDTENKADKLRKVSEFVDIFKQKCKSLYQPKQQISVDERLVKSKHRSGIRQYIKNKPVKFGIKLWVLADSSNGYTCDFNIYAGKNGNEEPNQNGLGYSVVMKLCNPLLNQGYHLFTDNFYTSAKLVIDLFKKGTLCCGTVAENRKGFPESMKGGKVWARKEQRGSMRWHRSRNLLSLQWKDNRVVTMLSSMHCANDHVTVVRKKRQGKQWQDVDVRQPKCIQDYNNYMNGVDRSDQILSSYNLLRKCVRWWKTLFFHMTDIACVNGYILFKLYQKANPDKKALHRVKSYSVLEFREELIRNLVSLEEFGDPPKAVTGGSKKDLSVYDTMHIPKFSTTKRNCKVCYSNEKKEYKVYSYCSAPQCMVYMHCTAEKNCFSKWHDRSHK